MRSQSMLSKIITTICLLILAFLVLAAGCKKGEEAWGILELELFLEEVDEDYEEAKAEYMELDERAQWFLAKSMGYNFWDFEPPPPYSFIEEPFFWVDVDFYFEITTWMFDDALDEYGIIAGFEEAGDYKLYAETRMEEIDLRLQISDLTVRFLKDTIEYAESPDSSQDTWNTDYMEYSEEVEQLTQKADALAQEAEQIRSEKILDGEVEDADKSSEEENIVRAKELISTADDYLTEAQEEYEEWIYVTELWLDEFDLNSWQLPEDTFGDVSLDVNPFEEAKAEYGRIVDLKGVDAYREYAQTRLEEIGLYEQILAKMGQFILDTVDWAGKPDFCSETWTEEWREVLREIDELYENAQQLGERAEGMRADLNLE